MSEAERIVATFERLRASGRARTVYLRSTKAGEYDPAIGRAPQKSVDHEAIAAFFDYSQRDIDGTVIRQGDRRVLMAPDVPRPKTGDSVIVPAVDAPEAVYGIVAVRAVEPALVPLLYILQARA